MVVAFLLEFGRNYDIIDKKQNFEECSRNKKCHLKKLNFKVFYLVKGMVGAFILEYGRNNKIIDK
jgi:hypothetical protein